MVSSARKTYMLIVLSEAKANAAIPRMSNLPRIGFVATLGITPSVSKNMK
jgi:hypothetical protein